jgi:antitoxin component of RelBE/YafQ-DinJ toxin-antitoxin module
MNTTSLHVTIEAGIKQEAQKTADELGLSLSSVVKVLLKQFIRTKQLSVGIQKRPEIPNEHLRKSLNQSEKDIKAGRTLSFNSGKYAFSNQNAGLRKQKSDQNMLLGEFDWYSMRPVQGSLWYARALRSVTQLRSHGHSPSPVCAYLPRRRTLLPVLQNNTGSAVIDATSPATFDADALVLIHLKSNEFRIPFLWWLNKWWDEDGQNSLTDRRALASYGPEDVVLLISAENLSTLFKGMRELFDLPIVDRTYSILTQRALTKPVCSSQNDAYQLTFEIRVKDQLSKFLDDYRKLSNDISKLQSCRLFRKTGCMDFSLEIPMEDPAFVASLSDRLAALQSVRRIDTILQESVIAVPDRLDNG